MNIDPFEKIGGGIANQMRTLRYRVVPPSDPDDGACWEVHCPDGVTILLAKDEKEGWEKAYSDWVGRGYADLNFVRDTPIRNRSDNPMTDNLRECPFCGGAAVRKDDPGVAIGRLCDALSASLAREEALREAFKRLLAFAESVETKALVGDEGCLWPVEEARDFLQTITENRK